MAARLRSRLCLRNSASSRVRKDEVVLESRNGHGPAKGVDEDWGELVFKSLRGVMVQAELRDLRRRCDEVALEVAFADAERVRSGVS
jgi:hypothetical protein